MDEFERSRLEKALNSLKKEDLCTIIESTGLNIRECWTSNIGKANHSDILKKTASRIDELAKEHWKRQAAISLHKEFLIAG